MQDDIVSGVLLFAFTMRRFVGTPAAAPSHL